MSVSRRFLLLITALTFAAHVPAALADPAAKRKTAPSSKEREDFIVSCMQSILLPQLTSPGVDMDLALLNAPRPSMVAQIGPLAQLAETACLCTSRKYFDALAAGRDPGFGFAKQCIDQYQDQFKAFGRGKPVSSS